MARSGADSRRLPRLRLIAGGLKSSDVVCVVCGAIVSDEILYRWHLTVYAECRKALE